MQTMNEMPGLPHDKEAELFLSKYSDEVFTRAMALREVIFGNLPGITEQTDIPAKMIAYCYGQKYADLVCTIIPSAKGLKLGFNRGVDLPDPGKLLAGTGKISRYVEIRSPDQIGSAAIKKLLEDALALYRDRLASKNTR